MADLTCTLLFFLYIGLSFILHVATFILIIRWKIYDRSGAHIVALSVGLLTFFLQSSFVSECLHSVLFLGSGSILLASFCYILFHFDNMGTTARRIRLLWELYKQNDGLTPQQLLQKYTPEEVFRRRINRLLKAGQCTYVKHNLVWKGSSYALIEKALTLWKHFVFGTRAK